MQYLLNVFCSYWKSEYLQSLQMRSKWNYPTRDVKVDDVVIIKDEKVQRTTGHSRLPMKCSLLVTVAFAN